MNPGNNHVMWHVASTNGDYDNEIVRLYKNLEVVGRSIWTEYLIPLFRCFETHGGSDVGREQRDLVSESFVASGQFVEKFLIERVALGTTARRHEDVASNELVNNLAVGGDAAKSDIDVAFKLYGNLGESKAHSVNMNGEFLEVKKYRVNLKLQMMTKYNVDVTLYEGFL